MLRSASMTRAFCDGDSLAKTVMPGARFGELSSSIASTSAPSASAVDLEAHVLADLARDDVIVAGQNLDRNAGLAESGDGAGGAVLRRIEKGDIAEQGQSGFVGDGEDVLLARNLLIGDGDDAKAVGVEPRGLLLAPLRDEKDRARRWRSRFRTRSRP